MKIVKRMRENANCPRSLLAAGTVAKGKEKRQKQSLRRERHRLTASAVLLIFIIRKEIERAVTGMKTKRDKTVNNPRKTARFSLLRRLDNSLCGGIMNL